MLGVEVTMEGMEVEEGNDGGYDGAMAEEEVAGGGRTMEYGTGKGCWWWRYEGRPFSAANRNMISNTFFIIFMLFRFSFLFCLNILYI